MCLTQDSFWGAGAKEGDRERGRENECASLVVVVVVVVVVVMVIGGGVPLEQSQPLWLDFGGPSTPIYAAHVGVSRLRLIQHHTTAASMWKLDRSGETTRKYFLGPSDPPRVRVGSFSLHPSSSPHCQQEHRHQTFYGTPRP